MLGKHTACSYSVFRKCIFDNRKYKYGYYRVTDVKEHKLRIISYEKEKAADNNEVKIAVSLKCLSNFWGTFEMLN